MQDEVLFERAQKSIPGGVNSPVRAFGGVGGVPRFIRRASGAYIFDAEDRRLIDYVGSWGPMILGHADADVIAAVQRAAENGLSFGAPTEGEIDIAELIQKTGAIDGARALGQFRHGSDDERHSFGAWFYGTRQNCQI